MYRLERTQVLKLGLNDAWKFFSSPANLQKITPSHMGFKILNDIPDEIYPGLVISYVVKPLAGIPLKWHTEITQVNKPYYFIDNQLSGPYRLWHHQHHFRECEGGVEMKDILHYSMPMGFVGMFVHWLFIRRKVEAIFDHRYLVLAELFKAK